MKLTELATKTSSAQYKRVLESHFGNKVNFDKVTYTQANSMLDRVRKMIGEQRNSYEIHNSETSPSYLKLMMLEQALASKLSEMTPPSQGVVAVDMNDQKTKMALDKASKGQGLNADEQEIVNAVATLKKEEKKKKKNPVYESEVQQAQVVLAAQDLVDSVQDMIEDVTEMQYKTVPALVDQIRNQVGGDQATQFSSDATDAMAGLVDNLQTTKQQLEAALGVVTGQEVPVPGEEAADLAVGGDELPEPADDVEAVDDIEVDDVEVDDDELEAKALGRERR